MKRKRQTGRLLHTRMILVGALGAIGGSAITASLLAAAYLAVGGGEREVPKIRRIPRNTVTERRMMSPGTAQASHARKDYRPEAKVEDPRIPEPKKTPGPVAIPREPASETVRETLARAKQPEETKVEPPKATPQKQGKAPATQRDPAQPWFINTVSLLSKSGAQRFQEKLKQDGWAAYITEVTERGKPWYGVRVGFFKSKEEAHKVAREISSRHRLEGSIILRQPQEQD